MAGDSNVGFTPSSIVAEVARRKFTSKAADDKYYATCRLAAFGFADYSREELIAEKGSAFICAEAGIESTLDNSAAYLKGWLEV